MSANIYSTSHSSVNFDPMVQEESPNYYKIVLSYHERTKHRLEQYANGPQSIDWEMQPDSFRRYIGVESIKLPLMADTIEANFADIYYPDKIRPHLITKETVSALLELSFGLSAWKQYLDTHWVLRCNPSSGNLHPTEAYIIANHVPNELAGIYHYVSCDHALEQRGTFTENQSRAIQQVLPENGFLIGLSSIPWREAWKYGERAFRYCQHDIGHAIAAVRYAAATLGWSVKVLANWSDEEIAAVLGLHRKQDFYPHEIEVPEIMLWVTSTAMINNNLNLLEISCIRSGHSLIRIMGSTTWYGTANLLDNNHLYQWELIDLITRATTKPVTHEPAWQIPQRAPLLPTTNQQQAKDLIRQRRSAQQYNNEYALAQTDFYRILDSTLPRRNVTPWDVISHSPRIHLILFVHRVVGLAAGLYILIRDDKQFDSLQAALSHEKFDWQKPTDCPEHLPLYHLVSANGEKIARKMSCHQDIAADSAFSMSMLAEFNQGLKFGAWGYRQLFWETGIIGQVLYLEAEAAGVRGTGIGCYFDDVCHSLLGLTDQKYQSLYHFTIGIPMQDERIKTLPPYEYLQQKET